MTTKEILTEINNLPENERAEIFAKKNSKLAIKDKEISQLNEELTKFKTEKSENEFKVIRDEVLTKSNVKSDYQDALSKLANIQVGDDKSVINNKIKEIKENKLFENFFNGVNNTVQKTLNVNPPKEAQKIKGVEPKSNTEQVFAG